MLPEVNFFYIHGKHSLVFYRCVWTIIQPDGSMSFPESFGSQLTAIMEALLKAVVAEVTALVEDGAVELRLELRDREQQILEKERDIEERDRVIEELRDAVEELTSRREEEDGHHRTISDQEDEDAAPMVKCEPSEHEAQELLWPPSLLPVPLSAPVKAPSTATANTSADGEYDEDCADSKDQTTQSFHAYNSQSTSPNAAEDFTRFEHAELNLETLLNMKQEQFYATEQPGFSMAPPVPADSDRNGLNWTKKLNYGAFRCEQCGKTFTGKKRLMTHQTVHTGVKPYSCEKCGTRFSRTDSLARHRRKGDACCPGKLS